MKINLVPSPVSFYVTHLTYKIEELHVNDSCNIVVYLCESDGNRIKRYDLCMSGEDYTNWGEDDMYLVDWICNKCGVLRQGAQLVETTIPIQPFPDLQVVVEPQSEEVVDPQPEEVVEPQSEEVVDPQPEEVVEPQSEEVVDPQPEEVVEPQSEEA